MNDKYTVRTSGRRDTTIVQQYPRDNDDGITNEREARVGEDMEGGCDNISPMIRNGKVPMD